MWLFILFLILIIAFAISYLDNIASNKKRAEKIYIDEKLKDHSVIYSKKKFMTPNELEFYNKIKILEKDYKIIPQVNLASIINITNSRYITELFRNIDFAIFDNKYNDLLLLIELNDRTHDKFDRIDRDLKVKKICNDAGIKLITFYTKYPNDREYVINRIKKEINQSRNIS